MVHYPRAATTACCFSPTQMEQANLFENQSTRHGKRKYGGRVHYHYMTSNSSVEAYGGAKMVHSTMTEMISNVSPYVEPAGSYYPTSLADNATDILCMQALSPHTSRAVSCIGAGTSKRTYR